MRSRWARVWPTSGRRLGRSAALAGGTALVLLLSLISLGQVSSEASGPIPGQAHELGRPEPAEVFPPEGAAWFDDMESGQAWTTTGLWHLTTSASASPAHAQWFGDEDSGTYAFSRSHGELTSPAISVGEGVAVEVSFLHRREVESYPGGAYDCTLVQISFAGGDWQTVWALDSRTSSSGEWEKVSLPSVLVPPGAATAQIRFAFDSVDPFANDYAGWLIDDVAVVLQEEPGHVDIPTFSPAPGTYAFPTTVYLSCGTPGATLRYTTTGAEPTETSPLYVGPIAVGVTTTIKARAFKAGLTASATARGTFAIQRVGFADDAESGQQWQTSGLWHLTGQWSRSPNHSQWFGDEAIGTYAGGAAPASNSLALRMRTAASGGDRAYGELLSPPIAVSAGSTVVLSFWHWREVEYYPGGNYDQTLVQVRFPGGAWRTVFGLDSKTPSSALWEPVTRELTVPAGIQSLRVRFVFDSVDGYSNDYAGWFIDDVSLAQEGPTLPSEREASHLVCLCLPNPVTSLHTARFVVQGAEAERLRVEVYDLAGDLVWEGEEAGTEVIWHAVDGAGLPVANAVYLYRALVQLGGQWVPIGIQPLAVLR